MVLGYKRFDFGCNLVHEQTYVNSAIFGVEKVPTNV